MSMISTYFYDYIIIFGTVNAVIIALLLVLATHYKYFYHDPRKVKKTAEATKKTCDEGNDTKVNNTVSEKERLNKMGYTDERLKEIARCALRLQDYEPPEEVGSGEPAILPGKQTVKPFPFLPKSDFLSVDSDAITDTDSMAVNFPDEDDQDDIDMSELTPDDIAIDEDMEDNEDGQISPEAIADIEAELLDSSILNESLEDQEEADAGDNALEDMALDTAESALLTALSEMGMESIIQDLYRESSNSGESYTSESEDAEVEEVIVEGEALARKSNYEVNSSGGIDTKPSLCSSDKSDDQHQTVVDATLMHDTLCKVKNLADEKIHVSSLCAIKEQLDVTEESKEVLEYVKTNVSVPESTDDKRMVGITCESLIKLSDIFSNSETNEAYFSTRPGITAVDDSSMEKCFLKEIGKEVIEDSISEKSSDGLSRSKNTFLVATELIAKYLLHQVTSEAVEEISKLRAHESVSQPSLGHGLNCEKAAKLQHASRKLSEEQLAEERRVQQDQLSNILALMEQNPEMFGKVTRDDMKDQATLYCI